MNARPDFPPANGRLTDRPNVSPSWSCAVCAVGRWAQTARVFYVTPATITSWGKRLDEQGPAALLRTPVPVNKFPDLVAHLVQRLQVLCPRLGKVKIAQVLARAGLHLGVSSVGRTRRQRPTPGPTGRVATLSSARRLTASYPNHLWHADLTTAPTSAGFCSSW